MSGNVGKLRGLRDTAGLLLPQIYHLSDGLPVGGAYEPALAVLRKHPDLSAKLVKKFGSEHPKNINLEKVDKAGADFLRASAPGVLQCLGPVYGLFEEIAIFQEHTLRVMTDLSQSLLAFSLDYTPQLLDAYMGLFVDACKVHILAAKVPRALIIQYYTFAHNHVHETDPPHFTEVSNFIRAFQDAIPRLQAEFQPINSRIGDVLEKIAAPLLRDALEFTRLQGRTDSFAWRTKFGTLPKSEDSLFPAIERAKQMQEWAFFGILVCPGETNRADVRGLLTLILRKSFKFVVFRKHAEWAHPLMERHVIPVLCSVSKKGHLSWGEKRDVKKVVEKAFGEACDTAMTEHRTHRIWLQQRLQFIFTQLQEDASLIPANVSTILSLLCLSRMELEWILLHGGDSLPRSLPISWTRSGFSISQPLKASFPDSSIASLLSIHSDVMQYLQSYKNAIQTGWLWILWEQLQTAVKPLVKQVSKSPTLTRHHHPVVRTIETLLDEYTETCQILLMQLCGGGSDDVNSGGADDKPTETVHRALASLPNACDIWFTLNSQLFSVRTNVSAQSLDALCEGACASVSPETRDSRRIGTAARCSVVQELNLASKLAEMVCDVGKELLRAGSLQSLGFQASKLQAVFEAAVGGAAEHAVHATSFLPALLAFHYNDHPKCHEDHGEVATAVAEKLMGALILRIRGLLHELFTLVFSPQATSAKTSPISEPTNESSAVDGSAASCHLGGAFHDEKASLVMSKLTALVEACSRNCTPSSMLVQSEQTVFLPLWWLREGFVSAFRTFLRQTVWKGKTLQRPSELEAQLTAFRRMLDVLQPYTPVDLGLLVREVLVFQSYTDLPSAPPGSSPSALEGGSTMLEGPKGKGANNHCGSQITDWLVSYIASDQLDVGIAYSLHNASFFTRSASVLQQQLKAATSGARVDACMYASLAELRSLARIFGPYVMIDLSKKLGLAAEEWVMNLAGVLKEHQRSISEVLEATDMRGLKNSAELIQVARQTHSIFKHLGRLLLMRQLSSLAYGLEHAEAAPGFVAGLARQQDDLTSHGPLAGAATALFAISPAESTREASSPDPFLVAFFQNMSGEDFRLWVQLPVVAALTVWVGEWGSAAWMAEWGVLSNDMHCTLHVMSSLATALARASQLRTDADGPYAVLTSHRHLLAQFASTTEKLVLTEGAPHPSQVLLLSQVVSTLGAQAVFSDSMGSVCMRHTLDPLTPA